MSLTIHEINSLIEVSNSDCVSIYLPTHPGGDERRQDPVRFKNLLRQARDLLNERGVPEPQVEQILQPGFERLGEPFNSSGAGQALAWFGSRDHHRALDLAVSVEPEVHVGGHYHTKPLIEQMQNQRPFYLLLLSKHGARLYDCSLDRHAPVQLEDVPEGLPGLRSLEEHQEYHHARATAPSGNRAVHHGHGSRQEEQRDLEQFVAALAQAVERSTQPGRPLVLAGPEEITAMYRQAHRSQTILVDSSLSGNHDEALVDPLRERAWELVKPLYRLEREAALERFQQAQGQGLPSSREVKAIVSAAFSGRVETLLLPARLRVPGTFDPKTLQASPGESVQAEDLLDIAARHTLLKGGEVHLFEPGTLEGPAALLRW